MENEFLKKTRKLIIENISDEQFGVSELASAIGMSRSNILRKIKKLTGLSASRYIRQVRLEEAVKLLRKGDVNVSEAGFKVGFSSTSYFIKCFREHYGYPPGELGQHDGDESAPVEGYKPSHQLAAIMFTDIQGYTKLMQEDEAKTINIRDRHREIFNRITKKFGGKILQYYGDGTLSTFSSANNAVKCGIELQLEFLKDPAIPVRIGIHTGDIHFEEDDIVGDGVNLAARVESLSVAGSVFISEKVYDEIKNQSGIQTTFMGKYDLKNVKKAMKVYAISNPGLIVPKRKGKWIGWAVAAAAIMLIAYLVFFTDFYKQAGNVLTSDDLPEDLSIAVLPFINDSDDSSNVYFINGLMESTLNDLQKIKELRVISRTSVEKYRNNPKPISEIAEELNVRYIIEGSGQKKGDQIFLHIQLIEAATDRHLLSEQYIREASDIFQLQLDIASQIADRIEVVLSPEEQEQISKVYTDDPDAYDLFMKGLDRLNSGTGEGLVDGINFLQQAIDLDPDYARAYAAIGIAYYYADFFSAEKIFSDSVNYYADQALLQDPELATGLLAKGMFYMRTGERELALPYLEKAHDYNPNSTIVLNMLSDYYATIEPNTEKYLEYAIRGLSLDPAPHDSAQTSIAYLHIANALVQSGFVNEARKYIERSQQFDPDNIFALYVEEYILFARDKDIDRLSNGMLEVLMKDTTRLDVLQESGKCFYYARDYETSFIYYHALAEVRKAYNMDIYDFENVKLAFVYREMGLEEEADSLMVIFKAFNDNDKSIYSTLGTAAYHAYFGNKEKTLEHIRLFLEEDYYYYWVVLFMEIEPLFDEINDLPEYQDILKEINSKFWSQHDEMRAHLVEKGLI